MLGPSAQDSNLQLCMLHTVSAPAVTLQLRTVCRSYSWQQSLSPVGSVHVGSELASVVNWPESQSLVSAFFPLRQVIVVVWFSCWSCCGLWQCCLQAQPWQKALLASFLSSSSFAVDQLANVPGTDKLTLTTLCNYCAIDPTKPLCAHRHQRWPVSIARYSCRVCRQNKLSD